MDHNSTIRVRCSDVLRIKGHVQRLSGTGRGRYAANDIVKQALDVYEEKINQTDEKSSKSEELTIKT